MRIQPVLTASLAQAIEQALIKTESAQDKELAGQMIRMFRNTADKAEVLHRSLPDEKQKCHR